MSSFFILKLAKLCYVTYYTQFDLVGKEVFMLWIKCALMASLHYDIPAEVVINIARVESRYCTMRQKTPNSNGTWDYGCLQLNDVIITHYRLNKELVKHDRCYNIWHGVRIMADLKTRFPVTWPCRWHVGSAYLTESRAKRCQNYLKKLSLRKHK